MPGTDSTTRFLAYAAFLTAAVAALAGYAADAVLFTPLFYGHDHASLSSSDLATLLTTQVVQGLFWTVVALYLAVPVAVTTSLTDRGDRHWLYAVVWSAAAIVALPLAIAALNLVTPRPAQPLFALRIVVAVVGVVAAGHGVAVRLAPDDAGTRPPPATFFNVVVAGLFVASYVWLPGALVGATVGQPGGPVLQDDIGGPPTATWSFEYEPTGDGTGLLTVTHDGGGVARADRLVLAGSGFAAVAGADQTAAGSWQGGTSDGSVVGEEGQVVARGDSVTVGVRSDPIGPVSACEVRVVWADESTRASQTVGLYECDATAAGSDDAVLRRGRLAGGGR